MKMDHEKLAVYGIALEFADLALQAAGSMPRGHAYLADQLRRAATSVVLNIAEGAGEFSRRDKARFYRLAKRSATESGAVLDLMRRIGFAGDVDLSHARGLLTRVVSMLVPAIRRMEAEAGRGDGEEGTGRGNGGRARRET